MTYPPSTAIRRAIYGRLASDTILNGGGTILPRSRSMLGGTASGYSKAIYYQVAPENASFPYVIFSKQSGLGDGGFLNTFKLDGTDQNDVWLVKAVDRNTSADAAELVANQIRTLLNDYTPGTANVSGGTIHYLRRESDINYSEVVDGELYFHTGSLYRVISHF